MLEEEHSKELIKNFIQGTEQLMMIVIPRHATEDEGEFQSEEQLEEAGDMPAGELTVKLSEEEAEKRISDETAEEESTAESTTCAIEEEEDGMGDLVDLPICREEVQWSRLQKKSQPLEQLDKVIEEIRRLMLNSSQEVVNNKKMKNKGPARASGQ
jgi:hypothetical protein